MMVTVRFYSELKRYANSNNGQVVISLNESMTIGQVLEMFNVIRGETGIVVLNSKLVNEEVVLKDGDVLELYPVVGGG